MTRGEVAAVLAKLGGVEDLDYRALSNAGLWCLGRLQTDADRARGSEASTSQSDELGTTLQRLSPRWFVVRNAHSTSPPILLNPRYAISLLRGPMTRAELRRARRAQTEARVGTGDSPLTRV